MNGLYRQFNLWRRLEDGSILIYRCFERIDNHTFAIQSADRFTIPIDEAVRVMLERQLIELFLEEDIQSRTNFFTSIEDAVADHHVALSLDRILANGDK